MPHSVQILPGSGGIVRYSDDAGGRAVVLRFREAADGRFEVQEVYFPPRPDMAVRSEDLLIPLARVEAQVNSPGYRERLAATFQAERLSLEQAALRSWLPDDKQIEEHNLNRALRPRSLRLAIPRARRYPDSFYELLAEIYATLAAEGRRPAAAIAEANGVPVSQVHGWIKEARRRGVLSPGRPGKAG